VLVIVDTGATATKKITVKALGIALGIPAGIGPLPYAGSSVPDGWLECDGSAVSRTTYADLFTAIGTTWGAGDGSTTFNLPDMRDKVPIGSGTGTVTEDVTASSSNGFTVTSNNTKWITGMAVVLSNLTGFTTTATAGPTYYSVRISATNVRLATTLALAQSGSPDITISGAGTATLTHTFTARTLGEYGGQESHAMTSTELLAHTHTFGTPASSAVAGSQDPRPLSGASSSTSSTGGNAAMNIMQPFAATKYIIKH
jgi:microcystin-dependent protein